MFTLVSPSTQHSARYTVGTQLMSVVLNKGTQKASRLIQLCGVTWLWRACTSVCVCARTCVSKCVCTCVCLYLCVLLGAHAFSVCVCRMGWGLVGTLLAAWPSTRLTPCGVDVPPADKVTGLS